MSFTAIEKSRYVFYVLICGIFVATLDGACKKYMYSMMSIDYFILETAGYSEPI